MGVLYRGALPITHAVESLRKAAKTTRVGYVTNNAARTPGEVAQQIASYGLSVKPEDVVTSPQAAIRVLARAVPAGSTILVVGGRGLIEEVRNAGFVVTTQADDKPAAVVQGFAPSVGWEQLAQASFALQRVETLPWIATNTDWTIPRRWRCSAR